MEADFWHNKWEQNKIGFHLSEVNPILSNNIHELDLSKGQRVFLPLCGKSMDIVWLIHQGFHVIGIELSTLAIEQLFEILQVTPTIKKNGQLTHFQAEGIDIYVGDFFDLTISTLGSVDAIYDRAALVALPHNTRVKYTKHLMEISQNAKQLLVCLEYDQSLMSGPPFSIESTEIENHYANEYNIKIIEEIQIPYQFKDLEKTKEIVRLLK